MPEYNIGSTTLSDMTNAVSDVTIDSAHTDGVANQEETEWTNSNWNAQLGIYKTIPEFKIALDMRAIWTIGDVIEADPETTVLLEHLTGWGRSTFRESLKNMIVTKRLGEDAYAEIIRDEETGDIINLKVLDTGSIKQIYNRKGQLIRYEQINKLPDKSTSVKKFQPREIFHLTNKRIADEIHGTSDSESLQSIMEANKESFTDIRKLMHRYVKPMLKVMLDTDDQSRIDAFITKFDQAVSKGENLFIPKDTVEVEVVGVSENSTLNPLPWREHLRNYFYQVVGIPQIIMGSSGEFTESTAKIAYLAFEQSVKDEQADIEEQVWNQLQLRIKLSFPASLRNELLSDEAKDAGQGMEFQQGDTTAGVAR